MSNFFKFIVVFIHIVQTLQLADDSPLEDLITNLPGWDGVGCYSGRCGGLPSMHYSGYLNITESKHYHYWFVEAENDPKNVPVVLWLNGGPGCSSLDGFFYEHGPFRINDDTDPPTLYHFEHNWAKLANMVYLESPVGVGFTYSDDDEDYMNTDETTMMDNLLAVEKFFELFPDQAEKDFYITGESYAGIYVPMLAEAILERTLEGTYKGAPLKGIAVGNGCTGNEVGVCGRVSTFMAQYFVENTAFVKPHLKKTLNQNCNWDTPYDITAECAKAIQEMREELYLINLYGVFSDCIDSYGGGAYNGERPLVRRYSEAGLAGLDFHESGPTACINSKEASDYLNQDDVIEAIHVKKQDFEWSVCGSDKRFKYSSTRPNLPRDTYPFLTDHIRVLIYNGDWDACVPYTDNVRWTEDMGYELEEDWHQWFYSNEISQHNLTTYNDPVYNQNAVMEQVGGYATNYANNFTFITIRGGRHEVPETAPASSYEMVWRFLNGIAF